jgi:hypothetical protein
MSGISRTSVRVSVQIGRGHRAVIPAHTDECRSRRYAGDFSCLPQIVLEDNRPPPPYGDDGLQRIPSSSTALSGDDVVTVFTSTSGTLTIAPIVGCPQLPVLSHEVYEQVQLTDAQRIVAQYRQRHCSPPDVFQNTASSEPTALGVNSNLENPQQAYPRSIATHLGTRVNGQATSAAPRPSPIRGVLVGETKAIHETGNHKGGTISSYSG